MYKISLYVDQYGLLGRIRCYVDSANVLFLMYMCNRIVLR